MQMMKILKRNGKTIPWEPQAGVKYVIDSYSLGIGYAFLDDCLYTP